MTDHSATIRDHLTKQRTQAVTGSGSTCMYRYGTFKCAVGCLIPDDKYSEEFEGLTVTSAKYSRDNEGDNLHPRVAAFFDALPADLDLKVAQLWQRYHDGSARIDYAAEGAPTYSYAEWCNTDYPAHSPHAFYEALRVYMANEAEPHHG